MGGLRRHTPVTFLTMFIGALAISGIFPLAGFFSKDEILWSAWAGGSFKSNDSLLVEVAANYGREYGEEVVPYIAPAMNLLRPELRLDQDPVKSRLARASFSSARSNSSNFRSGTKSQHSAVKAALMLADWGSYSAFWASGSKLTPV